jgi:hypothetical protein
VTFVDLTAPVRPAFIDGNNDVWLAKRSFCGALRFETTASSARVTSHIFVLMRIAESAAIDLAIIPTNQTRIHER